MKKKARAKNKQKTMIIDLSPSVKGFVMVVFIFIFVIGLTKIYSGFHTFDMGQNFEFIAYKEDIDLEDYYETTSSGGSLTIDSMYHIGLNRCIDGLSLIITDFFLAIIYMALTISWRTETHGKTKK